MGTKGRPGCRLLLVTWAMLLCGAGVCLAASSDQGRSTFPPAMGPPTQTIPDGEYVGREVCAGCHVAEAKASEGNSMAHAMELAGACSILRAHPRLTFRKGTFTYQILREGGKSIYKVTDGKQTLSEPILFAFGLGKAGQTYVFQHDGRYYQSRVSFYNDTQSLDITLGAPDAAPGSVAEALGEIISEDEEGLCFGCHATRAVSGHQLQVDRMTTGITCEGCHGPGGMHVAAVQTGKSASRQIFNPGSLSTGDLTRFCGSCHRTWEQVQLMHISGVRNVRFQPYRLANSRCFDQDDKRISCLACHDPHAAIRRDAGFYDAKCAACHPSSRAGATPTGGQPGSRLAARCPVGKRDCVACHMPKYALPGTHFRFTDHQIRIVRRGEPYPN